MPLTLRNGKPQFSLELVLLFAVFILKLAHKAKGFIRVL